MRRLVALADDHKDAVLELIREAHGEGIARWHETVWDWKIWDNPAYSAQQDYQVGLVDDGKLHGVISMMPTRVKIGPVIHPAAFALDLVVSPTAGRRNIAASSLKICGELIRISPTILYGNANDRVTKLWQRVLGQDPMIGHYRRHHRVLALAPVLRARFGLGRGPAAIIGAGYAAVGKLAELGARLRAPRDVTVRPVETFDPSFDALWCWASASYANLLVRDQRFLQWRFRGLPSRDYAVLGAYRGSDLVGYSVLRLLEEGGIRKALIVDLFTHRDEAGIFRTLLSASVAEARRRGAAIVSMLEACDPVRRREMRWSLFIADKRSVCMIAHSKTLTSSDYRDADKWLITLADADLEVTT